MSDPGKLRHRLVLEAPAEADDGAGGVVRSYDNIATVWAAIVPVALAEQIAAEALGARLTHRIVIRTGVDVTTRHRFKLGNCVFRVVSAGETGKLTFGTPGDGLLYIENRLGPARNFSYTVLANR